VRNTQQTKLVNINENTATEFLKLPASAQSGFAIAEALHAAISHANGHHVTLAVLAAQTGEPLSKIHRWFSATGHPHLQMITHLQELLSSEERRRFWDEHCRDLPTLKHPRLAHDPRGVKQLSAVLQKTNGLTWVYGSGHRCSFVLHALGHSFQRTDIKHRAPFGISVHPPESIVPLAKLIYLAPIQSDQQLKVAAQLAWASIRNSNSPMLLLDGVHPSWLQEDFLAMARTRNVVITGEPDPRLLAHAHAKQLVMHAIKVSAATAVQAPITVWVNRIELRSASVS
jgi:hypothetical protein